MNASLEMPKYRCHKEVWALKIYNMVDPTQPGNESDGSMMIHPANTRYEPFRVPHEYMQKHSPDVGGYYVVYADGYQSYSPAKSFEDGYSLV